LDFACGFIVLIFLMVYYGARPALSVLLLPVLIILITMLALGVGMITSALNVKYRDVGVLIPVLLQLWMYASPIVYPESLVPGRWRHLYELNPMAGLASGFRAALLGGTINWTSLAIAAGETIALLVFAGFLFRRTENEFADIV
jgi:lipopolysaccharide transport system permease protein